jgi:hypothetical protein
VVSAVLNCRATEEALTLATTDGELAMLEVVE